MKITEFSSIELNEVVELEVAELLKKQAIEQVPPSQCGEGFYSIFLMVKKKDRGFRPILNLKFLNQLLNVPHFKVETL